MVLRYTEEQQPADDHEGEATATYTVEQAIEKVGFGWLQFRIYVICKLIVATDALEVMLLALLGPIVQCKWDLQESQVAFISTVVFFGMATAAPFFGLLADHYGRRTCLLFTTMFTAYFGLLTAASPHYVWFLGLRMLVGVGMGGIPQSYSMIAEYIPSKYRAKMIALGECFWAAGALFEIFLAAVIVPAMGWRWLLVFSAVPVFIAFVSGIYIPESARFLTAAGRREEATAILKRTAAVNHTSLPPGSLIKSEVLPLGNFRDLFGKEFRRLTIFLWFLFFGSNFAYYGIVLSSPLLLTHGKRVSDPQGQCGATCEVLSSDDYISLAASTAGEFCGVFVSILLVDRIGRKWTGVLLFLVAALCFFLLQFGGHGYLITVLTFGARGSTLTLFNLLFIYAVEVYPTTMRSVSMGIASSWGRLASMITPFFAQMLMVYSLPLTVNLYGGVCVLSALVMYLLPVETLGRPMMQSISYETNKENADEKTPISPERH